VRTAIAESEADVRILLQDTRGRLRVFIEDPRGIRASRRIVSARREALATGRMSELRGDVDPDVVTVHPILLGSERFGLVELRTRNALAAPRLLILDALIAHVASALERLRAVRRSEEMFEQLDLGLAWTAHEIRTPLSAAVAALDRALDDDVHSDEATPLVRRARDELQGLSASLYQLLRSVRGGRPDTSRIELAGLTREVVDTVSTRFEHARVRTPSTQPVFVRADGSQLRSAIGNVLQNALKYSPHSSPVTVSVGRDNEMAFVDVRDHGPGVPPSEREMIFEPFVRGAAARGPADGSGLGLYVARRVAESHGGSLALVPRADGSSFRLEMPIDNTEVIASAS
jgi:signal transduction histidine kinase